jgi:radical SAM superfamily enzyme YgiQ (UPF0313 family)
MEPLALALLAALTPKDVELSLHDDRLEEIPFDRPVDLVAIGVETYTARRAYQIASEFRRRGVPVAMGGFHATLATEEVSRYAEAVVVGEAEELWGKVVEDARSKRLAPIYRSATRPAPTRILPDRSIFRGKRYLRFRLVETSRGCPHHCDFCAVQSAFGATQTRRPVEDVVREIREQSRPSDVLFLVDDNLTADTGTAKELFRALVPLRRRWVSQVGIDAANDEELLDLMVESGCQGILIGFESLDEASLRTIRKSFHLANGGPGAALRRFRARGIRIYGTFVFGYDGDGPESFAPAVEFAKEHAFFLAAFNHLIPFPGTPLHDRLRREGRLIDEAWWLDPAYRFNDVPFRPVRMTPDELRSACLEARREFFSIGSILRRGLDRVNRRGGPLTRAYPFVSWISRREVGQRDGLPLGDESDGRELLRIDGPGSFVPSRATLDDLRRRTS